MSRDVQRQPVVCALIEHHTKVLAACRKKEQSNGGLWEFPGGKVHDGEAPSEALRREIREELAVDIAIHKELPPVTWDYPWIAIELLPFICSIVDGRTPQPLEHAELRFITPAEALIIAWAPADRIIVERYYSASITNKG